MEATAAAYRFDTGTDIHDMILVNRTTGAVQIVTKTAWVDGPARHMADGVCRAIDIQPKL
jgi:hypothetical protein